MVAMILVRRDMSQRYRARGPVPGHRHVAFPPAQMTAVVFAGDRDRRPRRLLPSVPGPRRPIRRVVLHRGHLDRHLLPAQLPGHDAQARQRALLPHRGRRPAGRVPGLQAVPARRHPGLAGVGRPGRRGGPGHAAHRRRGGRPRRGAGPGRPARLQRAPARTAAAGRAGGRAAGPRPGPAGPDGPGPDRDDRRCPWPRWPSPPGSPASASSTTPSAQVFALTPTQLRRGVGRRPGPGAQTIRRCACRSGARSTPTTCSATWPRRRCPASRSSRRHRPTGGPSACPTGRPWSRRSPPAPTTCDVPAARSPTCAT